MAAKNLPALMVSITPFRTLREPSCGLFKDKTQ
jgi:hypothetical protein